MTNIKEVVKDKNIAKERQKKVPVRKSSIWFVGWSIKIM